MFRSMWWSEKRILGIMAMFAGVAAAILIFISATAARGFSVLQVVVGLGVLYGSYLIYRGKTSLVFGRSRARFGSWINLILGVATFVVPGGVGGTPSILAMASGILGLLSV